MVTPESIKFKKAVSTGACLVSLGIWLALETAPASHLWFGLSTVFLTSICIDVAMYATGAIWLGMLKILKIEYGGWTIGHIHKSGGQKAKSFPTAMVHVYVHKDGLIFKNVREGLGVLGGIVGSTLWLLICFAANVVAFMNAPHLLWWGTGLLLGALAAFIISLYYRRDPHPTPMWEIVNGQKGTTISAAARVLERLDLLFADGRHAGDLTVQEALSLREENLPFFWRMRCKAHYCEWLNKQGRLQEAKQEADNALVLLLERKDHLLKSTFSFLALDFALNYVEWGMFDRAKELNDMMECHKNAEAGWNGLQAKIAHHDGRIEDAAGFIRKTIKEMQAREYSSDEARHRLYELFLSEYQEFEHLIKPAFEPLLAKRATP